MATRERGPYSVQFGVNFTSGGDTTRDAFRKHMDEITRIYGLLTGLDADTIDASTVNTMLTNHINSTNPHPKWKITPSWADITNKPGLDDLGGTLTASKVTGALVNATIPSGNVTGLEAFVNGKIPADKGDGITESALAANGRVKFKNGLMILWGSTSNIFQSGVEGTYSFPTKFSSSCFSVQLTYKRKTDFDDTWVQLISYDKNGFKCRRQADDDHTTQDTGIGVEYIAIGV